MFYNFTDEELRSHCKTALESFEMWARRLIHEQMTATYGEKYYEAKIGENYLVKNDIRKHIETMLAQNTSRFPRAVDTLFFNHIVYFLCNQVWYESLFKPALDFIFPDGVSEARTYLERLKPIRNALSHVNPISVHQAEQAICYSHDFIEGIKQYYRERGLEQVWNVPRIIRITDSLGNVFINPTDSSIHGSNFSIPRDFHCGDTYSISIEVDSSFAKEDFSIKWEATNVNTGEFANKEKFLITFGPKHVSTTYIISCYIIQNKDWHKYNIFGGYDCKVSIFMQVLPPEN